MAFIVGKSVLRCYFVLADSFVIFAYVEKRPMDMKPPVPPFNAETAAQKVRMAEDAWNSRDPDRVVQVYTGHTLWRNRVEFPEGREQVHAFLRRKWAKELGYRLIKTLWAFAQPNCGALRV